MERSLADEIKELDQLPEPLKIPEWLKKAFILFLGITLLYLVLIYFIPSTYIIEFLAARSASATIQNNQLQHSVASVYFENNTLQLLQNAYKTSEGNEIKACLQGRQRSNTYYITSIHFPEILHQDFKSVIAKPCTQETVIDLHSHPSGRCFFSPHDVNVATKPMAIMCNLNTFNLYVN
tara:strand:- start:466 stop:1002 length:537 start_codon:yes stop_codon:yes gene_type:complete